MKRRTLILLLGGASSGAMSVGTGAFSSVEAERGVEVNVVDDDEAYLGLTTDPENGTFLQIKNQFAGNLSLSVGVEVEEPSDEFEAEISEEGGKIQVKIESKGENESGAKSEENVSIPLGQETYVTTDCVGAGTIDLEFTFSGTVDDSGTTVDKTRTFTVDCPPEATESESFEAQNTVSGVTFESGNSKIRINLTESASNGSQFTVTVYYENGSAVESKTEENIPGNETLKLNQDFGGPNNGKRIVGVGIDGIDGVFDRGSIQESGNPGKTVNTTVLLENASFQDQLSDSS